jgi:hypothetical protein
MVLEGKRKSMDATIEKLTRNTSELPITQNTFKNGIPDMETGITRIEAELEKSTELVFALRETDVCLFKIWW